MTSTPAGRSGASRFPLSVLAAARGIAFYAVDMAVFLVFFAVYYLGRGMAPERPEFATENALTIIDVEKALGIFVEQSWQSAILDSPRMVEFANFTYMQLHMPLLVLLGLLFFLQNARKHRVIRNTVLLSAFVAVPIYALLPVTPPRLLAENGYPGFGFVDTIPPSDRVKPGELSNWYAAIPSYHYGWNFLATVGVFMCWRSWIPRTTAVAFSALMWWAIVVTGNHYFLDMVIGVAFVLPCLWVVLRFERWADRNPEKVARFTMRVGPLRLPF